MPEPDPRTPRPQLDAPTGKKGGASDVQQPLRGPAMPAMGQSRTDLTAALGAPLQGGPEATGRQGQAGQPGEPGVQPATAQAPATRRFTAQEVAACKLLNQEQLRACLPLPDLEKLLGADAKLKEALAQIAGQRALYQAKAEASRVRSALVGQARKEAQARAKQLKLGKDQTAALISQAVAAVKAPAPERLLSTYLPKEVSGVERRFLDQGSYIFNRNIRKGYLARLVEREKVLVKTELKRASVEEQKQAALGVRAEFKAEFTVKASAYLPVVVGVFQRLEAEKMQFDFEAQAARRQGGMAEPAQDLEDLADIPDSVRGAGSIQVGQSVAVFLADLSKRTTGFLAQNYPSHNWGWYSVDFYLQTSSDGRGFYKHDRAVNFLLKVEEAAKATKVEWRAIYNDFSVAKEVNETLGLRKVGFKEHHGPAPDVLHVHMDVMPKEPVVKK